MQYIILSVIYKSILNLTAVLFIITRMTQAASTQAVPPASMRQKLRKIAITVILYLHDLYLLLTDSLWAAYKYVVLKSTRTTQKAVDRGNVYIVFDGVGNNITILVLAYMHINSGITPNCSSLRRFLLESDYDSKELTIYRLHTGECYKSVVDLESECEILTGSRLFFGSIDLDRLPVKPLVVQ